MISSPRRSAYESGESSAEAETDVIGRAVDSYEYWNARGEFAELKERERLFLVMMVGC